MSQRDIDVFNGNGSLISLVLVGNAASGKSCLIIRFVAGRFISDYEPTVSTSFLVISYPFLNGYTIFLADKSSNCY